MSVHSVFPNKQRITDKLRISNTHINQHGVTHSACRLDISNYFSLGVSLIIATTLRQWLISLTGTFWISSVALLQNNTFSLPNLDAHFNVTATGEPDLCCMVAVWLGLGKHGGLGLNDYITSVTSIITWVWPNITRLCKIKWTHCWLLVSHRLVSPGESPMLV